LLGQRRRNRIARSVWSATGLPALLKTGALRVLNSAGKPDALHTLRATVLQAASNFEVMRFIVPTVGSKDKNKGLGAPLTRRVFPSRPPFLAPEPGCYQPR